MKTFRAIFIGILIWITAVLFYTLSFYLSLMNNVEHQSNIVLFIVVIPLVWYGCKYYYKKDNTSHGYKIGQTFLLTSVILDAIITVPFFMIPNGINHYDFFTSIGFWVIALEFLLIASLFWYIRVFPLTKTNQSV